MPERINFPWRKSSYSNTTANCVEVAHTGMAVGLRDSKHPAVSLSLAPAAFSALLAMVSNR